MIAAQRYLLRELTGARGIMRVFVSSVIAPGSATMTMLSGSPNGLDDGDNNEATSAPWSGNPPTDESGFAPSSAPTVTNLGDQRRDGWNDTIRDAATQR